MIPEPMVRRLVLAASALCCVCPIASQAQSVDYGALQEVFGEPITASVTGKPQRASEVPGDLTIITQDDIRRSGADNLPDILQFVTGLDVRHYGFGNSEVAIRGYNAPMNPRLLVMVDGKQVYADDYGRVGWNALPVQLAEIRQIEVVKGPNSALFGFNASSGVINIITFDPIRDKVNAATIQGGTQSFGQVSAVGTAHIGQTAGVRISATGWEANQYSGATGAGPITDRDQPRNATVNVDGRWQISPNLLLRASAGQTDMHTPTITPTSNYLPLQNRLRYLRAGAVTETAIGTVDFDVYRNMAYYKTNTLGFLNDVLVAKLSDLVKLNANNTVRLGLEYRANRASGEVFGGAINYKVYSASALWDWQITPRLGLTNAVRVDHLVMGYSGTLVPVPGRTLALFNSATLTEASFNSGLVFKATEQDTVRVTAGRGLQVPSLLDFAFQLTVPGISFLGTPTLSPTAVWNTELAYDRNLAGLGATLTTAVFFQRNTNLLGAPGNTPFSSTGTGVISSAANIGSSNEIGFEIGLRGKTAGGLRWNGSYNFASITDDITSAAAANPNANTRYANGTPQHTIILGTGYSAGKWEMDAAVRWQSNYTDYAANGTGGFSPARMPNYFTLNGRVAYNLLENLTLALVGQQFDISRVLKPTGSLTERRLIASATAHF